MTEPRCALAKLLPTPVDAERIKRAGWREQGILVVAVDDDRLDFTERELVRRLGDALYGNKKKGAQQ